MLSRNIVGCWLLFLYVSARLGRPWPAPKFHRCKVDNDDLVWMLFVGRIIQAVSGSAGWIVAFATLTDNVASDHVGKVLGTAMSFVTAGLITGPVVSGALLRLFGHWATWTAPILLLSLGFFARLVMLENKDTRTAPSTKIPPHDEEGPQEIDRVEVAEAENEETALLPKPSHVESPPQSIVEFYRIILFNIRIIVGLLNIVVFATILSAFDTTVPLHLQSLFLWDPLRVGMIFLGLQVPGMLLGPVIGWLRDRVGIRYPTTIGWILVALLLWLLGIPGSGLGWADDATKGQIIFIFGVIGIGAVSPLIRGAGMLQLVSKQRFFHILPTRHSYQSLTQSRPTNFEPRIHPFSALMELIHGFSPLQKSQWIWE